MEESTVSYRISALKYWISHRIDVDKAIETYYCVRDVAVIILLARFLNFVMKIIIHGIEKQRIAREA